MACRPGSFFNAVVAIPSRALSPRRSVPAFWLANRAGQSVHGVDAMDKDTSTTADIPVERIIRMRVPALQRIHRLLFGRDSTVTHLLYLRRKLAWELQARVEGYLSEESRQHALAIAWQTTLRTRAHSKPSRPVNSTVSLGHDTRLPPPGTLLRRRFKGQSVLVKVLAAGFEYDGRIFGSLSPIANEVTGGNWNGFVFFGLTRNAHHGR
jgi:hypothetical protein